VEQKIAAGYSCLKLKVGALDFDAELQIIRNIRSKFSAENLEIRVDANGAFSIESALHKLTQLAGLQVASIEQPIRAGQHDSMAELCKMTPVAIALDEELIGIWSLEEKQELLEKIKPQHLILKPSLLGGFAACDQWIDLAESKGIGWWITSALESNIGLNAIAQYTFTKNPVIPQGLGTGGLFTNNIDSWLVISQGNLLVDKGKIWGDLPF
jgi:o-succinylbenzoate synthase